MSGATFIFLLCQVVVSLSEDFLSLLRKILRLELRVVLFDFTNPVRSITKKEHVQLCLLLNDVLWINETAVIKSKKRGVLSLNRTEPKSVLQTSTKNTKSSRNNLTPIVRRRSVVSVQFAVSGLLSTNWRDERRLLGECRGQRCPLAKTADRCVC